MEAALRQLVWQRAHGRCEYCQLPAEGVLLSFEVDHIIARRHRGPTVAGNLALACFDWNNRKGTDLTGIDPITRAITRLFHPRRHKWHRHFRWHGPELVGRTRIGRVTVEFLAMNLPHRLEIRQLLIDAGLFPPAS